MFLLKSEKRTSAEVAAVSGCCEMVVNNWLARYLKEGIKGLETRAGRGRPPILSQPNPVHPAKVKTEIKRHPNSVKTVIARLEEDLDLAMSPKTLRRLLKNEYRFCRARASPKSRQVAAEREEKEKQLKILRRLSLGGRTYLLFGDESAFSIIIGNSAPGKFHSAHKI